MSNSSLSQTPLAPAVREAARETFLRIVMHFQETDPYRPPQRGTAYSQPRLVRYTYDYALSDDSRDVFLCAFFESMELVMDANTELDFQELEPRFTAFADYLLQSFFLPLRASSCKTPQPSPASHSAVLRAQGAENAAAAMPFVTTPSRLSTLRYECLVRDRHRCVISCKFDLDEFSRRYEKDREGAHDDDGCLFSEQPVRIEPLEVAHILPHSLMKSGPNAQADAARQAALHVLNMFDKDVVHLIEGVDIDRPINALTLSLTHHRVFGAFNSYFEPVEGHVDKYTIKTFESRGLAVALELPATRTLAKHPTIDPPSPRLLAIHRAIALILHLSGAGAYIENVLRDMESNEVRSDGTSQLGHMVHLGMWGLARGTAY